MRGPHSTVFLSLALAASLWSTPLLAQSARAPAPAPAPTAAELSTARKLFADGLKAEDRGAWAEALALFERVRSIAVSPALYYHLAVCNEELGHLVEALNAFEIAVQEAERKNIAEVIEEASAHLKQLRPRIAQLTITLPPGAEDVRISLDDKPIRAALAGTAMLIDPGPHRLVIAAGNYEKPFEATLTTRVGESAKLTATLGRKKAAGASLTGPAATSPSSEPAPPILPSNGPSDQRPAYLVGGASLALGAGALITGLVAHDRYTDFREQNENPQPGSLAARQSLHDSGQALALTSTLLTGAALVGGGVTAFLYLRGSGAKARTMAWSPWVGRQSAGVALGGSL